MVVSSWFSLFSWKWNCRCLLLGARESLLWLSFRSIQKNELGKGSAGRPAAAPAVVVVVVVRFASCCWIIQPSVEERKRINVKEKRVRISGSWRSAVGQRFLVWPCVAYRRPLERGLFWLARWDGLRGEEEEEEKVGGIRAQLCWERRNKRPSRNDVVNNRMSRV